MTEDPGQAGTVPPDTPPGPAGTSAGGLLRQAREAAGVHIGALSVALKVPVRKLEALESDRLSYEAWTDRKIKSVVPMGTWQSPDDIASMVVFLSSKRAGQVTGQTINVDGGFVMHW